MTAYSELLSILWQISFGAIIAFTLFLISGMIKLRHDIDIKETLKNAFPVYLSWLLWTIVVFI